MAEKCYFHPESNAAGTCINCQKPVCIECKVVLGGETYCAVCADKLFVRRDRIEPSVMVQPVTLARSVSWFEQHLNLTMLVAWAVAFVTAFFTGIALLMVKPDITDRQLEVIGLAIGMLFLLPAGSWVLRKKNRNQRWLLLLLIPFGWVLFLLLENRGSMANRRHRSLKIVSWYNPRPMWLLILIGALVSYLLSEWASDKILKAVFEAFDTIIVENSTYDLLKLALKAIIFVSSFYSLMMIFGKRRS
ncbi:MAG: B-box zinc finger protein [Chloroflexota bacterium]